MTKIYILGSSGFIGGKFVDFLKTNYPEIEIIAKTGSDRIDVRDFLTLLKEFQIERPNVVVNLTGVRVKPNIDWCETHQEETVAVNVMGPIYTALAALAVGAYPIQIMTGCIYFGDQNHPFSETDQPNFRGSFYSRMKIITEEELSKFPVLQARIRMPVSETPHERNLISRLTNYKEIIDDIPNSVTLIEDLFSAFMRLIELRHTGILNLTNDGYLTHKDILSLYKEIVDPNYAYKPISLAELEKQVLAKRSNCVLDTAKRKSLGIEMPTLDAKRLREIMKKYKENLKK